jgi:hypothetical protein
VRNRGGFFLNGPLLDRRWISIPRAKTNLNTITPDISNVKHQKQTIWQAKSINGGVPKYSTSVLIPKTDTKAVAKVKAWF